MLQDNGEVFPSFVVTTASLFFSIVAENKNQLSVSGEIKLFQPGGPNKG